MLGGVSVNGVPDTPTERIEKAAIALATQLRDEVAFQPVRLDGITREGNSEDHYRRIAAAVLDAIDAVDPVRAALLAENTEHAQRIDDLESCMLDGHALQDRAWAAEAERDRLRAENTELRTENADLRVSRYADRIDELIGTVDRWRVRAEAAESRVADLEVSLQQAQAACSCGTPGLDYEGPQEDCELHGEIRSELIRQRNDLRSRVNYLEMCLDSEKRANEALRVSLTEARTEALATLIEQLEAAKPHIPPSTDPKRRAAIIERSTLNKAIRLARAGTSSNQEGGSTE